MQRPQQRDADTDTHLLEHTLCLSRLDLHSWSRLLHQRVRLHLSHLYCAFTLKTMRHHSLILVIRFQAIITFATVGFGDYSPTTRLGRVLGALMMIFGVLAFGSLVPQLERK